MKGYCLQDRQGALYPETFRFKESQCIEASEELFTCFFSTLTSAGYKIIEVKLEIVA